MSSSSKLPLFIWTQESKIQISPIEHPGLQKNVLDVLQEVKSWSLSLITQYIL
jgi:hypothetical protein